MENTMKIGQPADKPPVAGSATGAPAAQGVAAGKPQAKAQPLGSAEAAAAESAKVELSSTAAVLLSPAGSADFDAAKVKRMGDAIAAGSFVVDAPAIADKLIANARELLDKVKG